MPTTLRCVEFLPCIIGKTTEEFYPRMRTQKKNTLREGGR